MRPLRVFLLLAVLVVALAAVVLAVPANPDPAQPALPSCLQAPSSDSEPPVYDYGCSFGNGRCRGGPGSCCGIEF